MKLYPVLLFVHVNAMIASLIDITSSEKYIHDQACYYYSKEIVKEGSIFETIDSCQLDGQMFPIIGLSSEFKKKNEVKSGRSMIYIPEAIIDDDTIIISKNTALEVISYSGIQSDETYFIGNRVVLAVKIDAIDTETSLSTSQISDTLFGTGNDTVTMSSQVSSCSYNQLNFIPFNGTTPTGEVVINGVGELFLPFNLIEKFNFQMEYKILNRIEKKYGALKDFVDHIILILPENSGNFIAWAYFYGMVVAFKDVYVHSPTNVLHELFHNLGFDHSSEKEEDRWSEYGDTTGVMGYGNTYGDDKKCLNGAKSWYTGWYSKGHVRLDPFQNFFDGKLVGVAEYDKREGSKVLIKIVGHDDGNDYFISFNRKVGMNAGSTEDGDKVIITSNKSRRSGAISKKRKALSAGDSYVIANFGGSGKKLTVLVEDISIGNATAAYAHISILQIETKNYSDGDGTEPGTGYKKNKNNKGGKNNKKNPKGKNGKNKGNRNNKGNKGNKNSKGNRGNKGKNGNNKNKIEIN